MAVYYLVDFIFILLRSYIAPIFALYRHGILGLIIYYFVMAVYYEILKLCFDFENLSVLDEFFLMDYKENRSNIITVVKLDKIKDYDLFRNFVI